MPCINWSGGPIAGFTVTLNFELDFETVALALLRQGCTIIVILLPLLSCSVEMVVSRWARWRWRARPP
jgi:hypothetical protein